MAEPRRCPKCEAELPADAPEGLCPKCLLEQGMETQRRSAEAGEAATPRGGFVPPSAEELAPLFPQLEIIELLGCGGMGAVYKARQPSLDRLVALKIIRPEAARDPAFAERFAREARALARLSHPNIVAVHDFGQAGELCYFVMEYVDGASLRQMERAERLSPAQALAIVPQICDALQYAHEQGVVHRDIKPENILMDGSGRVKIADFGLAKLLGRAPADFTLTGSQTVLGTPHYMAPEQIERPAQVDQRADIYSLGVVFYEMLTGELPLGRFAPPSQKVQVDVRLDEVVLKTLEKEPERRYQRASEVKTDVETISSTPPPVASSAPPVPVNYLNNLLGFFMTPQPEWGRAVGIPLLILTGTLICAWLAVTIFVPEDNKVPHLIVDSALSIWPVIFVFPLVFLTLLWKVRSGKRPQSLQHPGQLAGGEGEAGNQVRGPALGVMGVGFMYVVLAILFAVAGLLDPIQTGLLQGRWSALQPQNIAQLAAFVAFMVLGVVGLVGGWKMLTLRSYGLAVAASIVTLPAGFWGLAVLSRPGVRAAFAPSVSKG